VTTTPTLQTQRIDVAGLPLAYDEGGAGTPLLVLPHETGAMEGDAFRERLARSHRVLAVTLPGWDGTPRPEWMRSVRDMAVLLHLFLDRAGVDRLNVVGLGFGGWLAAEMATMNQARFAHMALVNPVGLLPDRGEILDQFLLSHEDYLRAGFGEPGRYEAHWADGRPDVDELVRQDENREMTARIAWKPYLYSQTLPELLREVRVPTQIVWATGDRIAPESIARRYADLLPHATLERLADAGHFAELEQPERLAALIDGFCAA